MSQRNLSALLLNAVQFSSDTLITPWRKAMINGDVDTVCQMMNQQNERWVSANFSTDDSGESPLVTLLMNDKGNEHVKSQQCDIAEYLIQAGCHLNLRDNSGMLPADWAMLSENYDLAKAVIRYTIIEQAQKSCPEEHRFIPNARLFFLKTPDEAERLHRFEIFVRNQKTMGNDFTYDTKGPDRELGLHMTIDQIEYWEEPTKINYEMVTRAPMVFKAG